MRRFGVLGGEIALSRRAFARVCEVIDDQGSRDFKIANVCPVALCCAALLCRPLHTLPMPAQCDYNANKIGG